MEQFCLSVAESAIPTLSFPGCRCSVNDTPTFYIRLLNFTDIKTSRVTDGFSFTSGPVLFFVFFMVINGLQVVHAA